MAESPSTRVELGGGRTGSGHALLRFCLRVHSGCWFVIGSRGFFLFFLPQGAWTDDLIDYEVGDEDEEDDDLGMGVSKTVNKQKTPDPKYVSLGVGTLLGTPPCFWGLGGLGMKALQRLFFFPSSGKIFGTNCRRTIATAATL